MRKYFILIVLIAGILGFQACKKSTENLNPPNINDYYPMKVGKYIVYQLDSFNYIRFGTKDTITRYQLKYEVDAQITDNLGRPAYRIIRYIRKTAANPWGPDNTFAVVPYDNAIEFIENNLRFIKLKSVMQNGNTWKGNSFIDTYSLNSNYKYLDSWDYSYDSLNLPSKIGTLTVDSCVKVLQRDEVIGNPTDPNSYSEKNFAWEKYARGIGMVYKYLFHNEYQPPTPGRNGYYQGYGITLTMIDHN